MAVKTLNIEFALGERGQYLHPERRLLLRLVLGLLIATVTAALLNAA